MVGYLFFVYTEEMKAKRLQKTRKSRRSKRVRKTRKHSGGRLGMIPAGSTVSIQQDPYSPRELVDAETAEQIFDARNTYLL
jgi:hypothetical protein